MSDDQPQKFDLFLSGELRPGQSREQALVQLASLFKRPQSQLAPLLAGKPHCIKRALSAAQLQRYEQVLHNIGVLTLARPAPQAVAGDTLVAGTPLQLSPSGTPVLTEAERQRLPAPAIDTSAISLAPSGSTLATPSPAIPLQPPAIDHLQLAQLGADLADEPLPLPGIDIEDLAGSLSLAPPGSAMSDSPRPVQPPPPDISHLKLQS